MRHCVPISTPPASTLTSEASCRHGSDHRLLDLRLLAPQLVHDKVSKVAAEELMQEIAATRVGPVVTAGAFRIVIDTPVRLTIAGTLVSLAHWAVLKKRSALPSYPYLVLTTDELVLLEFRFGAKTKLKRVVGRWPIAAIRIIEALPERWRTTLVLPSISTPAKLEGLFHSSAERAVVSQLEQLASGSS